MSEPGDATQRSVQSITLDRIPATCISEAQRRCLAQLAGCHTISYRLEGGRFYVLIFNGQAYELQAPDRWICRDPAGYTAVEGNFVLWSEHMLFSLPQDTKTRKRGKE